jgi:CAAX protease family protein
LAYGRSKGAMSALSPFAAVRPSPAAVRIAPFALFVALLALEQLIGNRAGDLRWLVVLRPLLVAGLLAYLWRHYTELHAPPRAARRDWLLAALLGIAVFVVWVAFDRSWAALPRSGTGFDPGDAGGIDVSLAALRLAGFALVVPVMEELFWRSYVLRRIATREFLSLHPRAAGFTAFALSSALFATEHSLWFAGLLAGIAYNVCFMRSGNLWVSILSHAITNAALGIWILSTGSWQLW